MTARAVRLLRRGPLAVGCAALTAVVVGSWLWFPVQQRHTFSQDATAFVAAARLAPNHPADVYERGGRETERFVAESCLVASGRRTCPAGLRSLVAPFVSPPLLLPLIEPLGSLSGDSAVLVLREVAAASLVLGLLLVWRRVGALSPPAAPLVMLLASVALTPFAFDTIRSGQPTGLMLVSVMLPLDSGRAVTRRAGALALGVIGLFKLVPLALFAASTRVRRGAWHALAGALAVLAVVTAWWFSPRLFSSFVTAGHAAGEVSPGANTSVDGLIARVWHGWTIGSGAYLVVLGARLVVVGWAFARWVRDAPARLQWAWWWVALLLLEPLTWSFYLVVLLGAALVVVEEAVTSRSPVRRRQACWLVGVAALVVGAPSLGVLPTSVLVGWPVVWASLLLVAAASVATQDRLTQSQAPGPRPAVPR